MIRKIAGDFLLNSRINTLPFNLKLLEGISKSNGWELGSYSTNSELIKKLGLEDKVKYDAFTYIHTENNITKYFIFYKNSLSINDKMFCILHEFGHILLGHDVENGMVGTSNMIEVLVRQENEANEFACEVLAPSSVLKRLNVKNIEDIKNISAIPLKHLEEHSIRVTNFDTLDDLSKNILKIFKNYIEDYQNSNSNMSKSKETKTEQEKIEEKSKNTKKVAISSLLVLIGFIALFIFNSLNKNKHTQAIVQDIPLTTVIETTTEIVTEKLTELTTQEIVNNQVVNERYTQQRRVINITCLVVHM